MSVTEVALDITSMGLVSSVGHDVVTACAAIRAGISRPAPIPEHPCVDLIEHEATPLVGHPITPITDGFCSGARWLQIAPLAFDDLLAFGQLGREPVYWQRTAIVVLLPSLVGPRFEHDERARLELLTPSFEAAIATRLPAGCAKLLVRGQGRAGLAQLVIEAPQLLRELGVDRLAVVAVDSYLDPFALNWLQTAGRLKDDFTPTGLVPGEAAAALMLEPAGRHQARARARLVLAGVATAPGFEAEQQLERGRALAGLLRPALTQRTAAIYSDLNGETWRAEAHGYCLGQLGSGVLARVEMRHPASEVGDVGAASLAMQCTLAAREIERGGWASIVTSAGDENGQLGVLNVHTAGDT